MDLENWIAEADPSRVNPKGGEVYSIRVAVPSGTTSKSGGPVAVLGGSESGGRWRKQSEAEEKREEFWIQKRRFSRP